MAKDSSVFPHPLLTHSASPPETTSPSNSSPEAPSSCTAGTRPPPSSTLRDLPLDLIDADYDQNDRFALDANQLRELADSIRAVGLINPIRVAQHGDRFDLQVGYRRLEAFRLIGRQNIPALVTTTDEAPPATLRLAENLIRADLTPVEEARTVARLLEQTHHTTEQMATLLNRSPAWIQHRIDLANYPEEILDALHLRQIKLGVADELALVRDPAQRSALLRAAADNGCTARTAALWRAHANAYIGNSTATPTQAPGPPVTGPPPTVHKQCFACQQPFDITTLSYITVCADCLATLEQALTHQRQATAQMPPPPR